MALSFQISVKILLSNHALKTRGLTVQAWSDRVRHVQQDTDVERNLGPQPIAQIMAEHGLKPHDLVAASTEQLTHKMVSRACKGRRLTPNVRLKVLHALNRAAGKMYAMEQLFTY
ncbi:MAG: hypothetical protein BWK77_05210 [Verrucomicrobia bacterium A1]|nr:MAG: hypothetical protein BWK77_05210 [Verrucomicrobia bacterium A1]